ncbi:hypothetical protein [Colwellia sp. C1TZA3]|nr:hypothetical protein [Colwellia sp. C1TZA3]
MGLVLRVSRQKIDKKDSDSSDILFFIGITHETIVDKMKILQHTSFALL